MVFEVLDDNGTTFDVGNWLDKYETRMDTSKGLFANGYKVPPPVPVPETAMEWVSRSASSPEVTASESSSQSPAAIHKPKAPVSSASQRPPGSAWNTKVRELNAKIADILGRSCYTWLQHPTAYDSQWKPAFFLKGIRKRGSILSHGEISLSCFTRRA